MSRSGMCEDGDDSNWGYICFRGAVKKAVEGKRGQAFIKELIEALDAMPVKELIEDELEHEGQYCAMGAVGAARGIEMSNIDVYDYDKIGEIFGIAPTLVREIEYENDTAACYAKPEEQGAKRWQAVRNWAQAQLKKTDEELVKGETK